MRHFEEWGALGARWIRIGCALDPVDGALYVRCGVLLVVRWRCVGVRWGAFDVCWHVLGHVRGRVWGMMGGVLGMLAARAMTVMFA